ncbi:MAG: hypothetical protein JO093_14265 [Acidobacteria bacterium]|nr:hypothetical protein [Acidobacteriota bacterium]MBV9067864.1 hypothetical protein [Acidobacteriota bacterium]MBV9186781.1 hypothetical protein [Acidobacteriota bacterium]
MIRIQRVAGHGRFVPGAYGPPLSLADGGGDDAHPHPSARPPAEAVTHKQ